MLHREIKSLGYFERQKPGRRSSYRTLPTREHVVVVRKLPLFLDPRVAAGSPVWVGVGIVVWVGHGSPGPRFSIPSGLRVARKGRIWGFVSIVVGSRLMRGMVGGLVRLDCVYWMITLITRYYRYCYCYLTLAIEFTETLPLLLLLVEPRQAKPYTQNTPQQSEDNRLQHLHALRLRNGTDCEGEDRST